VLHDWCTTHEGIVMYNEKFQFFKIATYSIIFILDLFIALLLACTKDARSHNVGAFAFLAISFGMMLGEEVLVLVVMQEQLDYLWMKQIVVNISDATLLFSSFWILFSWAKILVIFFRGSLAAFAPSSGAKVITMRNVVAVLVLFVNIGFSAAMYFYRSDAKILPVIYDVHHLCQAISILICSSVAIYLATRISRKILCSSDRKEEGKLFNLFAMSFAIFGYASVALEIIAALCGMFWDHRVDDILGYYVFFSLDIVYELIFLRLLAPYQHLIPFLIAKLRGGDGSVSIQNLHYERQHILKGKHGHPPAIRNFSSDDLSS